MYPARFEYQKPKTIAEALDLLREYGDDAKLLAGGQSLVPVQKLGLGAPGVLIDLNGLTELEYVEHRSDVLAIGALARHASLDYRKEPGVGLSIINDAIPSIADPQVRNRGTVVGALAEGDPAGDWGSIFLALGGDITCVGRGGSRVVAVDDLFVGLYTTAVAHDEIITEVRFRLPRNERFGTYIKMERKTGDFAIVGVAVQLDLDADGGCRDVRIGLTGVAPTPVRARESEGVLRGSDLGEAVIADAVGSLGEVLDPWTDMKGPADYKRRMAGVQLARGIRRVVARFAAQSGQRIEDQ